MATTSSENHHREHAIHNEKVYQYLRQNLEFIDWVITVAFYSALHYVEHKIFPCVVTVGEKEHQIESMEEYHEFWGKKSIHASRKKAVKEQLSTCRTAYEALYSQCMTARYHQYKYEEPEAIDDKVEKWLGEIKAACRKE